MTEVIEIIQSLGFPIAVCVLCFWYINKKDTDHHNEVALLTDAINEMRVVLQSLVDHLGG